MKTIIMAGGKGTRISSVAKDIPKPLIPICGKPVLQHEIECLVRQGFTDIIITVGYLGQQIIDYFGDGNSIGANIEYYFEKEPLGNAGALFRIMDKIESSDDDSFLLLNADSVFDIDFKRFIGFHKSKCGFASIFTHPNSHPYDSGLVMADEKMSVTEWLTKEDKRPNWYKNRVNAGLHIIDINLLKEYMIDHDVSEKVDLDRDLLKPLAGSGRLFAYDSPEYVKDMGTPERYESVCIEYASGYPQRRNLINKQKAIFLDRDGTINKYVGFLKDVSDFELIPNIDKAVHIFHKLGYLVFVVTNQPVIARGEMTLEELEEVHNKMETLLGKEGEFIDGIEFCPHHPDRGFIGERIEYKIKCDCRKPSIGMITKLCDKYNIDLRLSWMVGDTETDIETGKNAGCKTCLVNEKPQDFNQDYYEKSVYDFAKYLVSIDKR